MPPELYAPAQKRHRPAATIEPPATANRGRVPPAPAESDWPDRMRHPFATSIRVTHQDARRFVVAALPNWSLVGLSVAFLVAAYALGGYAVVNGAAGVDAFLMGVMVLVLLHVSVRYLFGPLGGEQTYAFDKGAGTLTVTTKGLWKDQVDRYRLRDVVKLHVNRVDDGIYDPGTLLVIFKGGGTLQFPAHPGVPKRADALAEALARFLAVTRSDDGPARAADGEPAAAPAMDLDELALEAWLGQHAPSVPAR
jgi:hypothetical protein